jgi:hypothetical protein
MQMRLPDQQNGKTEMLRLNGAEDATTMRLPANEGHHCYGRGMKAYIGRFPAASAISVLYFTCGGAAMDARPTYHPRNLANSPVSESRLGSPLTMLKINCLIRLRVTC